MNQALKNKNVLLFAPKFFGYENAIANKLIHLGANVVQFDERPKNTFWVKALIRIDRDIIKKTINNYYTQILEKVSTQKFDFVFVVNLEAMTPEIVGKLRQQQPQAKFVLYMWDSIKNKKSAQLSFKLFDWCYSFDKNDSETLPNVAFRPLFFIDEFDSDKWINEPVPNYDLCFIGTVHSDRFNLISTIKNQINELGLKVYFYMYFHNRILFFYKKFRDIKFIKAKYSEFNYTSISASQITDKIKASKVILDIQHPNQTGLTMRTIEMQGASRKLITTNHHISTYDFYNPHNILIIDRQNPEIPANFFQTSFVPLEKKIRDKYAIEGWILEIFKLTKN